MRLGRALAEGHDRIEREPVRPCIEHQALELPGDPPFRDTEGESIQDPAERRVRRRLRAPDQLPLLVVLHPAPVLDDILGRDQLHIVPQRLVQPSVLSEGHAVCLDPEPRNGEGRAALHDRATIRTVGCRSVDVRHLATGLFLIPPVRQEELEGTRDQDLPVRTGEARQVSRVGEVRNEERVYPEVLETGGDRASPQLVIHGIASSAR